MVLSAAAHDTNLCLQEIRAIYVLTPNFVSWHTQRRSLKLSYCLKHTQIALSHCLMPQQLPFIDPPRPRWVGIIDAIEEQ